MQMILQYQTPLLYLLSLLSLLKAILLEDALHIHLGQQQPHQERLYQ
jgi:hypothetical protein